MTRTACMSKIVLFARNDLDSQIRDVPMYPLLLVCMEYP